MSNWWARSLSALVGLLLLISGTSPAQASAQMMTETLVDRPCPSPCLAPPFYQVIPLGFYFANPAVFQNAYVPQTCLVPPGLGGTSCTVGIRGNSGSAYAPVPNTVAQDGIGLGPGFLVLVICTNKPSAGCGGRIRITYTYNVPFQYFDETRVNIGAICFYATGFNGPNLACTPPISITVPRII